MQYKQDIVIKLFYTIDTTKQCAHQINMVIASDMIRQQNVSQIKVYYNVCQSWTVHRLQLKGQMCCVSEWHLSSLIKIKSDTSSLSVINQ